jgi:hypothetical protein
MDVVRDPGPDDASSKSPAAVAGLSEQQSVYKVGASVQGHDSVHADEDETEISDDELTNIVTSQGRKRRLTPSEPQELHNSAQTNQADLAAAHFEESGNGKEKTRRRSNKQRKMSNAKHPLDVGATTDEGSP